MKGVKGWIQAHFDAGRPSSTGRLADLAIAGNGLNSKCRAVLWPCAHTAGLIILHSEQGTDAAPSILEGARQWLSHDKQRCCLLQELRSYLHTHRSWLAGLLTGSSSNAGHNGVCHQSKLLSCLLSGLLKCCDPEVKSHQFQCLLLCHCIAIIQHRCSPRPLPLCR